MVGAISDDGHHYSQEDPPPFDANEDFMVGLDDKSIRRAFIRKVMGLCHWSKVKINVWFHENIYLHLQINQQDWFFFM